MLFTDGYAAEPAIAEPVKTFPAVRVDEWPDRIQGDSAWEPADFASEADYTLFLSQDEVAEVRAALLHFNSLNLYGNQVSATNFPLPTLGPKLRQAAADVHRGRGFAVVRGLDPADYSPEDNVVIFLGVSSYIAPKRGRQDEDGNMLAHIRNAKLSRTPQCDRPTRYSKRASTYHTDTFCDVLALHTRSCAQSGGRNLLASSHAVYNRLASSRPDVLSLLAQPVWAFDSRGDMFAPSVRPLLFHHGGKAVLNFAREPLLGLGGVTRPDALPLPDGRMREALDVLEDAAQEVGIRLEGRRGDMLFVNNHAVLHSREAFEDRAGPGGEDGRYIVRAWLRNPALAWKLPRQLVEGHERIYGVCKGREEEMREMEEEDGKEFVERWNVVDTPRFKFRLSERLSS